MRMTRETLQLVADYPHLIGHLAGKNLLTDIHSDWAKICWDAPAGKHIAMQSHRGAYKTTAVTEVGIIYDLLFHPSHRIALIRETFTEANRTLDTIKKYMSLEPIKALFTYAHGIEPKAVVSREGTCTFNFKKSVTKEGSIDAYGINQVPTGSHYDRILCDDIITINSRMSRAMRERVKLSLIEIMTNIIDPGKNVIVVGTPWHHDDAWHTVNEDGECILPEIIRYYPKDTGILDDAALEAKRKVTTKSLFAINYMLDDSIKDEGQIFEEPIFGEWDNTLPKRYYHAQIDAAWDGECTNALTILYKKPEDTMYHGYGKMYEGNILEHKSEILRDIKRHNCRILHIEDNPDKGMLAREFKSSLDAPVVIPYHEHMNKDVKIETYLKKYWDRIIWSRDTDPRYLSQIDDYRPGQDPRDCPDSAASCLREAFYPTDPTSFRSSLFEM